MAGRWTSKDPILFDGGQANLYVYVGNATRAGGVGYSRRSPLTDPVRYRNCPECGEAMLRKNFRESSGVIVDVCFAHGLWFDSGELVAVIEFAETGALTKAERDIAERAATRKKLDDWERTLRAVGPRHYEGPFGAGTVLSIDALADVGRLFLPGVGTERRLK